VLVGRVGSSPILRIDIFCKRTLSKSSFFVLANPSWFVGHEV